MCLFRSFGAKAAIRTRNSPSNAYIFSCPIPKFGCFHKFSLRDEIAYHIKNLAQKLIIFCVSKLFGIKTENLTTERVNENSTVSIEEFWTKSRHSNTKFTERSVHFFVPISKICMFSQIITSRRNCLSHQKSCSESDHGLH